LENHILRVDDRTRRDIKTTGMGHPLDSIKVAQPKAVKFKSSLVKRASSTRKPASRKSKLEYIPSHFRETLLSRYNGFNPEIEFYPHLGICKGVFCLPFMPFITSSCLPSATLHNGIPELLSPLECSVLSNSGV
jgi:hypothetical protein